MSDQRRGVPDSSIVAHVVVVGFHAQLGNRIEFAYPRLRGDPVLRSPKVSDSVDISSSDCTTPTLSQQRAAAAAVRPRNDTPAKHLTLSLSSTSSSTSTSSTASQAMSPSGTSPASSATTNGASVPPLPAPSAPPPPSSSSSSSSVAIQQQQQSWGILPDEWAFLPFMALPDGVHDHAQDVVFFTLPSDVHCVSCFRQIQSHSAKTHSASATRGTSYELGVAARGSVQKSVVLLCRRPLFGALADRLIPCVRAYFDQADFANTTVLSSLFHSLNVSLTTRPSLASSPDTLFHGLDLQTLVRKLGPQLIAVLKLVLLERRVVVYSQPVRHASNAVVALASIFHGALDCVAPSLPSLDTRPADMATGFPLNLFGGDDRVILQPYAPLPLLSQLIPNTSRLGCLIGTSHNVGLLLSTTAAAHARKVAAANATSPNSHHHQHNHHNSSFHDHANNYGHRNFGIDDDTPKFSESVYTAVSSIVGPKEHAQRQQQSASNKQSGNGGGSGGGVPVVDALVNLSTGRVSVSAALEPLCRVTHAERNLMRDLVVAASRGLSSSSSSSSDTGDEQFRVNGRSGHPPHLSESGSGGGAGGMTGSFVGSDDYIRSRLRQYLQRLVQSVSTVDGLLGGPVGCETWSEEMAADFDFSALHPYNDAFVRRWVTTRNCAQWARACVRPAARNVAPPPLPEVDLALGLADNVAAGLSGLRRNVEDLGRLSSVVSARAAQGIASLFRRIEQEVAKMDTAVGQVNSQNSSPQTPGAATVAASPQLQRHEQQQQQQQRPGGSDLGGSSTATDVNGNGMSRQHVTQGSAPLVQQKKQQQQQQYQPQR